MAKACVGRASIDGVTATDSSTKGKFGRRLLGGDEPRAFGNLFLVVGIYWVLDVLTRSAASLDPGDPFDWFLAASAARENPLAVAGVVLGLTLAGLGCHRELLAPWSRLAQGATLRMIVTPLLVLVTWYGTFYEFNYLLDRWHLLDRLLVLGFALAAWRRPIFMIPLVLEARIVADQFATPLGATASNNIGDLLLIALLCVAATHVFSARTKSTDSSSAMLLLTAAVAAHFFAPGRAKVAIDWISTNDLSNFSLNSYTAGWLGSGDGGWARDLASIAETLSVPLMIGTVILEFGAVIAVLHRRILPFWLVGWMGLHAAIFAMSGFFLLEWVVLEVVLLVVVTRRDLREWVAGNFTPARAMLSAGLVVFGGFLFHPPNLAWFDARISYGYEIEAVTTSGDHASVPLSAFAPLQENLSLAFAEFRTEPLVVGGYGAADSRWLSDQLEQVSTFAELEEIERQFPMVPEATRRASELLITTWLDHVNADESLRRLPPAPPSRYWTSRPSPTYDFGDALSSVEVILVTSIRDGADEKVSRASVLTAVVGADGRATVGHRAEDDAGG
jgi:hypothetical protein